MRTLKDFINESKSYSSYKSIKKDMEKVRKLVFSNKIKEYYSDEYYILAIRLLCEVVDSTLDMENEGGEHRGDWAGIIRYIVDEDGIQDVIQDNCEAYGDGEYEDLYDFDDYESLVETFYSIWNDVTGRNIQ